MNVSLAQNNLAKVRADAIVNAADISLEMGGGVAGALKKAGGREIEEEALEVAPLELGQAVATMAGNLDAKYVIHAAVIRRGEAASAQAIESATQNALEVADALECETIAFPALGCGVGGFGVADAARIILSKINAFSSKHLQHAFVILNSKPDLDAFAQTARELGITLHQYVSPKIETKPSIVAPEDALENKSHEDAKSDSFEGDATEKENKAHS